MEEAVALAAGESGIQPTALLQSWSVNSSVVQINPPGGQIIARTALVGAVQQRRDAAWSRLEQAEFRAEETRDFYDAIVTPRYNEMLAEADRTGQSPEDFEAEWAAERAVLFADFNVGSGQTPVRPPYLGPGSTFHVGILYPPAPSVAAVYVRQRNVPDPSSLTGELPYGWVDIIPDNVPVDTALGDTASPVGDTAPPPGDTAPPPGDTALEPDPDPTCSAFVCGNGKTNVCHKPGEPAENTICISTNAVPGHIAHGDVCGECE
jgi:hypothetical protein